MPTNGLSFYISEAVSTAAQSLTYGFEVLSVDDLTVVGVHSITNQKVVLIKDTDFTVDLDTQTVTCTSSSWGQLTKISQLGDSGSKIRIYRTTSVVPLIDFKAGAVLSEGDLDTAYKQGLFAAQEMVEDAADTGAGIQSVTSAGIADGAVISDKIATDAVTTVKIDDGAVTSAKLDLGAVTAFQLANDSVGSSKLVNNSVITAKLADNAVTTAKIANDNVTQAKVDKADQSEMQSQSSTDGVVTPDVLKYSPFSPRCYGVVTYDTASAAYNTNASYNVASVTEDPEDKRTITFSVPLSDVNYVVVATMQTATTISSNEIVSITNKSTTSFTMESVRNDATDLSINFVVFGSTLSA